MKEVTFGFVKPDAYPYREQIWEEFILPSGLSVVRVKDPYYFTEELAREHYKEHIRSQFFESIIQFTVYGLSGLNSRHGEERKAPTALYVLEGEDALRVLDKITGPTHAEIAKAIARETGRETIRSKYGTGAPDNGFHRADSYAAVRREIMLHFRRDELPKYVLEMLDKEPYNK